jgi:hypothetical protein
MLLSQQQQKHQQHTEGQINSLSSLPMLLLARIVPAVAHCRAQSNPI